MSKAVADSDRSRASTRPQPPTAGDLERMRASLLRDDLRPRTLLALTAAILEAQRSESGRSTR